MFCLLGLRVDGAGDKDPAVSLVVSLLTVRCRTGQKFFVQSFITASSSFAIVCTAGRAMVESAVEGMEISGTGDLS